MSRISSPLPKFPPKPQITQVYQVNAATSSSINKAILFGAQDISIINVTSRNTLTLPTNTALLDLFNEPLAGSVLSWTISTDASPITLVGETSSITTSSAVFLLYLHIISISPLEMSFYTSPVSEPFDILNSATGYVLFAGSPNTISSTGSLYWDITNQRLSIGQTGAERALQVLDYVNPQLRLAATGTGTSTYVDVACTTTGDIQINQTGDSISIGQNAGGTILGTGSICIGLSAGQTLQGANSIALGYQAAQTQQSSGSVAIGYQAGRFSQGPYSIALGYQAGATNQATGTIVINATSSPLNATGFTNAFCVKPIRNNNAQTQALCYDAGSGEITYSTSGTKTFIVDHPVNDKKYLVHGCLEGPEAGVYYRGVGKIEGKVCKVSLPAYVSKLATDFTVQITRCVKDVKQLSCAQLAASPVEDGVFTVYGDDGDLFCWHVYGTRLKIETEPEKDKVKIAGQGPYKYVL